MHGQDGKMNIFMANGIPSSKEEHITSTRSWRDRTNSGRKKEQRTVDERKSGQARERKRRCCPRANDGKRRSGRKPGARVTNFVLAEFKVVARGS